MSLPVYRFLFVAGIVALVPFAHAADEMSVVYLRICVNLHEPSRVFLQKRQKSIDSKFFLCDI